MAKLKPLKQKAVIKILENNGFIKTRSGKHFTFKKKMPNRILTTWVPHHEEVSVFVIGYIIKQSEKPREEFE
ncbi:type II toxin-antitoxin system HicA family toxin [Candidatus Parcubacteria bacterium]|nr:type II toxin-antitoxin system HicA family toxin [Candidatus Parcubacteria bacterium]